EADQSLSHTLTLGLRTDLTSVFIAAFTWPRSRLNMGKRTRREDDGTGPKHKRVKVNLESLPGHLTVIGQCMGRVELSSGTETALFETIISSGEKLLNGDPFDGVEILQRGVFALPCAPDLVFRISNRFLGHDLRSRWSGVHAVARILKDSKLDLLVLPRQGLFMLEINDQTYHVIAEERLPLTNNFLVHEELYASLGARLEPALRQLVALIIASGFYGVDSQHLLILNKDSAPEADLKIGLVDVSQCGRVWGNAAKQTYHKAFFGDGRTLGGLFACIAPEHFEVVKAEALKHQVTFDEGNYYEAWKDRCHQFAEDCRNRELASDLAVYESRVKGLFETVATALSTTIPPTLELVTEPATEHLDAPNRYQLPLASWRFRVRSVDQPDLVLRGGMVLERGKRSLVSLAMSIQGSIVSSSLIDATDLGQRVGEFCRNYWMGPRTDYGRSRVTEGPNGHVLYTLSI
ncbi:hypothetical protein J3F84DRAFT_403132, partial [Trichoderma pleuroticola]